MPGAVAPLVLVAIDGADDRLVREWAAAGLLPTLGSLLSRGSFRRIGGRECVTEHGTLLSLVSGVSRGDHGYYCFRRVRPGTYELEPFGYASAATPPFWAQLRATGRRVAAVDPPDGVVVPGLDGFQLCGWAMHEAAQYHHPLVGVPEGALALARRAYGRRIRVSEFVTGASARQDLVERGRFLERVRRKGELFRTVAGTGSFDLAVFGFYEAHTAGHRFWRYRGQQRGDGLDRAIRDVYQAIDREIGLLLQACPAGANVFVVSGYGMEDHYPTEGLLDAFCRELGYHVPAGAAPQRPRGVLGLARALLPHGLREWLGRRAPVRVQERLLAARLRDGTDWTRTRAFSIPHVYTGFIRVNLRGREPAGIVEPGAEYDALLRHIEQDLRLLVDPLTGRPAVSRVVRTAEQFGREAAGPLPDLFVNWEPARHLRRRLEHPRAVLEQQPPAYLRDSYHSFTGFVLAAGPDVRGRGDGEDVDLLDLAPTFLSLLGAPVPAGLPGKPLWF